MADKTSKYEYVGLPGAQFRFPVAGALTLNPGDTVALTDEEAESVGGDFAPVAKPKPAPAADPKES